MKKPNNFFPLAVVDKESVNANNIKYYTGEENTLPSGEKVKPKFITLNAEGVQEAKWYYYPDHRTDEVLVFLTFDGAPAFPNKNPSQGKHTVFHSAFRNSLWDKDREEPRTSTEIRLGAWWTPAHR